MVAVLSMVGVATVLLRYPAIFTAFKLAGGAYLVYLGIEMWRSRGNLAIPDVDEDAPLAPQLTLLLSMILTMELTCLMLYANGGSAARALLAKRSNVRVLNRIAGTLIIGVGVWLALD